MQYFSGFCLANESELFEFALKNSNDFTIAGFSYGAIKAFEAALHSKKRVDKLILISPAFFNDKDEKFKKMQLLFFAKDKASYIQNFLKNIASGSDIDMQKYFKEGNKEELKELLYYKWDAKKLQELLKRGVTIEVFLGENDKIINSKEALEFFKENATNVYFFKRANHILKAKND